MCEVNYGRRRNLWVKWEFSKMTKTQSLKQVYSGSQSHHQ